MTTLNPAVPNSHPDSKPDAHTKSHRELQPRRTARQILLSYFYWTYSRGSFHYDVMVTLILLFIFVTPQIPGWSFGDRPASTAGLAHPIQVIGNGGRGLIITVQASDVPVPAGASEKTVRKILRKAIEPVTGDAVVVERWETVADAQGNLAWRVWAYR
ncbi:MAG: hypothetical protein ABSF53_16380 [Terracidiphilus sp.]|jgi:hypothetical protein